MSGVWGLPAPRRTRSVCADWQSAGIHFPKPASPDLFGGVRRNFQVFDPLDFIAELTQHIPEPRTHLVRYFGWYSNKSRGMRAKTAGDPPREQHATRSPSAGAARRRWAALIKRVWQVDPLRCPRCGSTMKIVSFIEPTQPDVIQKILAHCGLADEPPRAPPPGWANSSTSVISSSSTTPDRPSPSGRRTDQHW
jgi:hypothetical protein